MKWNHTGAPKNHNLSEVEVNQLPVPTGRPLPDPMGFNDLYDNDSDENYGNAEPVNFGPAKVGNRFEVPEEKRWIKYPTRELTNEEKAEKQRVKQQMNQNTLNIMAAGIRTPNRPTRPQGVPWTPYSQGIRSGIPKTPTKQRRTRRSPNRKNRKTRRQHKNRSHRK